MLEGPTDWIVLQVYYLRLWAELVAYLVALKALRSVLETPVSGSVATFHEDRLSKTRTRSARRISLEDAHQCFCDPKHQGYSRHVKLSAADAEY